MSIKTSGNPVKKPGQILPFTPQMKTDFLRCCWDPKYFIENFVYVQHPTKGRMLFKLYDYQIELIDSFHGNRNTIALCGRQLGKTSCAAAYLLWRAMFMKDQGILIVANVGAQAMEIMKRIRFAYEECPDWIKAGSGTYNKGSLEFDNGSHITARATTANSARGLAVSYLYADEFAAIDPNMVNAFWSAVSPTLATGGGCIITSTPASDLDLFASIWRGAEDTTDDNGNSFPGGVGRNGFKAIRVKWDRHPDRDQAWANAEIGKIGIEKFESEHGCIIGTTLIDVQYPDGTIKKMSVYELARELNDQ